MVHRVTGLLSFQIILKEREEKKGRLSVDQSLQGADEEQETDLNLTPNQSEEVASQEGQNVKSLNSKVYPAACFKSWAWVAACFIMLIGLSSSEDQVPPFLVFVCLFATLLLVDPRWLTVFKKKVKS